MTMNWQEIIIELPLLISCFIFFLIFPKRRYGMVGFVFFMGLQSVLFIFQSRGWADGNKWIVAWMLHYILVIWQMYLCNELKLMKAAYMGTIAYNFYFLLYTFHNIYNVFEQKQILAIWHYKL